VPETEKNNEKKVKKKQKNKKISEATVAAEKPWNFS